MGEVVEPWIARYEVSYIHGETFAQSLVRFKETPSVVKQVPPDRNLSGRER